MAIQSAYLTKDDFRTIAMDATTGAVLWDKRYNGPASDFDDPYGIAVAPTAPACSSPAPPTRREQRTAGRRQSPVTPRPSSLATSPPTTPRGTSPVSVPAASVAH